MRSIQVFLLVCIASALAAIASADQPPLTITRAGYFLTELDASGIPVFRKLDTVVDLTDRESPPSDPVPPVEPDPPVVPEPEPRKLDLEVVTAARGWSAAIADPLTAQGVAQVYSHVADAHSDGLVTAEQLWPTLRKATDSAIATVGSGKDWKPFRDQVSARITLARQQGKLAERESILILLASVQQGLEMSADGSAALSLAKSVEIAKRTNEAIDAN
jgi:hypothetical protein